MSRWKARTSSATWTSRLTTMRRCLETRRRCRTPTKWPQAERAQPMKPAPFADISIGSPVNPVLGVKYLADKEDLDFTAEGPMPLLWQRSYRSNNTRVGWCGVGWGLPLEVSLESVLD